MNFSPGQQLGSYRLVSLIGQGGFASVYVGEHKLLKTKAAIKILGESRLSERETERFLQEAKIIAELRHPNIIRLLEFAIQDGCPYLVMEYIPGGTLAVQHDKGTTFTLSRVVSYVKQVAAALQYAHNRNLVHRDVKPSNMLIQENGEIVLSDFGIAVVRNDSSISTAAGIMGTPMFMAPEQILGRARAASDQYALAVSVYFWLCGVYPFQGSIHEIVYKHLHVPPLPPSKFNSTIPPMVERVLLKALEKKPEDRFATVEEFARSLEQASLGQEVAILKRPPKFSMGSFTMVSSDMSVPDEPTVIQDSNTWQGLPSQQLATPNEWISPTGYALDSYSPSSHTYAPYPSQVLTRLANVPKTVRGSSFIGLLMRFPAFLLLYLALLLIYLFTYLLVIPLLILLTPLLLLFHHRTRARLKAKGAILEIPKRRSWIVTVLSSLPLPKGFWPTRLLTSEPALTSLVPGQQNFPAFQSAGEITQSPTMVGSEALSEGSIDGPKVSGLKGSWRRITYFAMKGPSFLRSPTLISPQIYTYKPPRSQQANAQKVIPPDPQASVWKPFPEAQPKVGTAIKERKNFCVMYHNNDHDRNWAEWITWLLEEDGLSIIMPEWDFRAGYNVDREIRKAFSEAERVIVIVSPDYLDTRNTQWGIVFNREMMSREGMILPIIVKECALRKPLDTLVSINLVGRDIFHTSEKLRKAVRLQRTKPTKRPDFPPTRQETSTTSGGPSTRRPEPDLGQQQNVSTGASKDTTDPTGAKTIHFSATSEEATISLSQIAAQIESAFNRKDCPDVIRKSRFLAQQLPPTAIPWKIYRMQALAYHAQGQMEAARTAFENALTLISSKEERLALLDEYANALASLKRWQEMLIYTEEALTIVPNDIRWQALREQVTKQMNQEKPLGSDEQFPKSVVQDRTIKEADQKVEQMETMVMPTNPISIFIAYALNDAELCAALKNHLTTLIYEHRLRIWYDHDISPGQETMKIIKERLNASHMIILLVSGHFLGSEYHRWQTELALEMHRVGTKRIIPILLKPSDWETTPLRELQALPKDKRPVTAWPDKDEALVNIVRGIRSVVEDLRVLS